MRLTDDQIANWSKPPSESEDARCTNAIGQASEVLRAVFGDKIKLIRQGSHTNRTNIRIDSDVDMAVVYTDSYFPDLSFLSEYDKAIYLKGQTSGTYPFINFKNDVENALRVKFGTVERKNKCLRVPGNTNRTPIDIVPAFEHKRYSSYNQVSVTGIEFITDNNENISSFPEQHYSNGISKNTNTSRSFKRTVRILKRARERLVADQVIARELMSSFFIESLVWNAPNATFNGTTWRELSKAVVSKIWNDMQNASIANDYAEVSNLRWLFRGNHRTYAQAQEFMLQAWRLLAE